MKEIQVTIKPGEELEHLPEALELVAESIVKIADSLEAINESRLKRRAVIALIQLAIGPAYIGKREITLILDCAPELRNLIK